MSDFRNHFPLALVIVKTQAFVLGEDSVQKLLELTPSIPVINPPVGIHGTSAAKVEFFDRASVDRLMNQSNNGHIRGHIRVAAVSLTSR